MKANVKMETVIVHTRQNDFFIFKRELDLSFAEPDPGGLMHKRATTPYVIHDYSVT